MTKTGPVRTTPSGWPGRARRLAAGLAVLLVVVGSGHLMAPSLDAPSKSTATRRPNERPAVTPLSGVTYQSMQVGSEMDWTSDKTVDETTRQVGPLVMRVRSLMEPDGEAVAPTVTVTYGSQIVTMTGEYAPDTQSHRITAVMPVAGGIPAVMLQSYDDGPHCCTTVQVAMVVRGALKVVDIGKWDGEPMDAPIDISGDGVMDIVRVDQSFLYAFGPYATSFSPPTIRNIIEGRSVDVSRRPDFAAVYREAAKNAGEACRNGEDGFTRNGACAAYVASAARSGTLRDAWREMLTHHDGTEQWDYPEACRVPRDPFPAGMSSGTTDYVGSLLSFLRIQGYVPLDWNPPLQDSLVARTT